jgi:hypothetical protein
MREAFAALDAGTGPATPTWTHAGGRQVEAGFADPALGWIGVRADSSGGAVHASLVPGSSEAAQELGSHMDGLNAYLAEQHTPVASLAMATPGGGETSHGAGQGAGHGTNQGAHQGANQGTDQGMSQGTGQNGQQQAYSEPESSAGLRVPGVDGQVASGASAHAVAADEPATLQSRAGVHISVMA